MNTGRNSEGLKGPSIRARQVSVLLGSLLFAGWLSSGCSTSGTESGSPSGGNKGNGGATSTGGVTSAGGSGSSGGTSGTGGTSSTGGTTAKGGTSGSGGAGGSGGATGSGGTAGSGGIAGSGGTAGTAVAGGTSGNGGTTGAGGTAGNSTGGKDGGVPDVASGSGGAGGGTTGRDAGPQTSDVPGSGGSTGTGGAGTGGSTSSCSVAPIDPSATTQTKNLLCYLYSIYGSKVLSGQQETSWSNPQGDIDYYVSTVSKHPAILGGDYLYPSGTTSRAQAYWTAGGITMLRYHMGAPPNSDTYDNSKGTVSNFDNLTKSGTAENTSLNSKLDYLATELKTLQTANVPVILVPYHEVDKYAWFWWSKGSGAQFLALWKYTINYINTTKGVHNVLWTLGFGHDGAMADYYPGKDYIDLGGIDEYEKSGQPFASHYTSCKTVFGSTVPIPLHETGTIPQPSAMFPSTAPWLLWNVWATYQNTNAESFTWNTADTIKTAYADSHTITRETLPNLK